MSVNPYRGEVALVVDGVSYRLRLTLGALAGLEARLEAGGLMDLVERFETGRFSAGDLLDLLSAGLEGGGAALSREALAAAEIEGGPLGAAKVAARLLYVSFTLPEGT
ncbi:MAG: gene transfer agent family protein [Pseudomonadota bacterium]